MKLFNDYEMLKDVIFNMLSIRIRNKDITAINKKCKIKLQEENNLNNIFQKSKK